MCQRSLDGARGKFHDEFAKRSQPFIDCGQAQAGRPPGWHDHRGGTWESETAGTARVLVGRDVKDVECARGSPKTGFRIPV